MKTLFKLPISMLFLLVLVSCSSDSPNEPQVVTPRPNIPKDVDENTGGNNNGSGGNNDPYSNPYFGMLDGDGSSDTYIDMPIESSSTHLFVGRWGITKVGIDENNDGNIRHFNYQDYNHKDCGLSFLQFNNDGVVFENSYYKNNGVCTLYAEIDTWELIEPNRFKIYVYDIIYLVEVTETQLILKYDWAFENSLWAPMQVYYYYERILPPE